MPEKTVRKSTIIIVISLAFIVVFQVIGNIIWLKYPGVREALNYNALFFAVSFSVIAWAVASWFGRETENDLEKLKSASDVIPEVVNKFRGLGYDIESIYPAIETLLRIYHDHRTDIDKIVKFVELLAPYASIIEEQYGKRLERGQKLSKEEKAELLKEVLRDFQNGHT